MFAAVKASKPTPELLAYQYLQTLPQMAQGDANKVWVIPSEFSSSLEGFAKAFASKGEDGVFRYEPAPDDGGTSARPGDDDEDVIPRIGDASVLFGGALGPASLVASACWLRPGCTSPAPTSCANAAWAA